MDDVLIYSESQSEHRRHVRWVLQKLREAGLQADIKKSEFEVSRTKFLSLVDTTEGIEMDLDKTAAI